MVEKQTFTALLLRPPGCWDELQAEVGGISVLSATLWQCVPTTCCTYGTAFIKHMLILKQTNKHINNNKITEEVPL